MKAPDKPLPPRTLADRFLVAFSLAGENKEIVRPIAEAVEQRLGDHEQVQRLLNGLQGTEADVVRMFHLEGKSYEEIGAAVGMSENSIGPLLSRARNKMRQAGVNPATG